MINKNQKQLKKLKQPEKKNTPPPPKVMNPIQSHPTPFIPSSPSIFDSIKQGFGFGLGSSLAHKAVDSVFNSTTTDKNNSKEIDNKLKKESNVNTTELYDLYNKCLEEKNKDIKCNDILENKIREY